MDLSPTMIALLAPIGVILGGFLTALFQRSIAKGQLKAQRKLAADQRLWDKEMELYEAINRRAMELMAMTPEDVDERKDNAGVLEPELQSRAALYLPPRVSSALKNFLYQLGTHEAITISRQLVEKHRLANHPEGNQKFDSILADLSEMYPDTRGEVLRANKQLVDSIREAIKKYAD